MIVDHKPNLHAPSHIAEASTSEHRLSVVLPNRRQVYTTGSQVAGVVNLSSKEPEKVQEVQVSLVCAVRSIHHRYLGGQTHDIRRETTKLIHRDQTLWTSGSGGHVIPPASLPFDIIIPEVGNDTRAKNPNTPLPPSFHAGKRRGWKNVMTYGTPIGYIKYYIKVSVTKKGKLNTKDRAFCPFFFLPPSSPPPLLPPLPESIPDGDFSLPPDNWCWDHTQTSIRQGLFTPAGRAHLTLWLPRATPIARRTRVPFFLCLTLETSGTPPAVQPGRATLFLRQTIRSCARGGRQMHSKTYDAAPTDNLLHGLIPQVSPTRIVWRGLWTACDTPNFANRQLSWEYSLVADVPIKGIGNGVVLETRHLEVCSGVTSATNIAPESEDVLDVPPEYFEPDASMGDDDEDDGNSNGKA